MSTNGVFLYITAKTPAKDFAPVYILHQHFIFSFWENQFKLGWPGFIGLLNSDIARAYYIFFTDILLVAFGSAWYHYNPNNTSLVWDRQAMP